MDREHKSFPTFVKSIEDRMVKQVFSVFGVVDVYKDRIKKGAFKKTINERMEKIKVLWQHDFFLPPIATLHDAYEVDAESLPDEVRSRYPEATGGLEGVVEYLDTPRGNEVLIGIEKGAITENSIGFDAIKTNYIEEEVSDSIKVKIRELTEIRLWDLSPVNWGANPATFNRGLKTLELLLGAHPDSLMDPFDGLPFEVIQFCRAMDDLLDAPFAPELEWFDELEALSKAMIEEAEPQEVQAARTHFGLMQSKVQALTLLVESYGG